jgi:tRNA pseudouridine55 synthase
MLEFTDDHLTLRVACSKGTYIRVLAADIGKALGCGAHLVGLRRTVVGDLDLARSVTLAELEALDEAGRTACLQPVDALLQSLPSVILEGEAANRFRHGNPVDLGAGSAGKNRVYVDGRLIGVGEPGSDGRLWPKRLVQLAD